MFQIITFIIIYITVVFIVFPIIKKILSNKNKIKKNIFLFLFSSIQSIVLLIIVDLFLNSKIAYFNENFNYWDSTKYIEETNKGDFKNYINNNFSLINTAFNKISLPHEDFMLETNSNEFLTDRFTLSNFLNFVYKQDSMHKYNLIDMVIIDVVFERKTQYDSILRESINKLGIKNKITLPSHSNCSLLTFENDWSYNANATLQNGLLINHKISENNEITLPYKIYETLELGSKDTMENKNKSNETLLENIGLRIETNNRNSSYLVFNEFPVNPTFTYAMLQDEANNNFNTIDYSIGLVYSKETKLEIYEKWKKRKKDGFKNIVFIGDFPTLNNPESNSSDLHLTSIGPMNGSVYMLNVIYHLHMGFHKIKLLYILIYFIILTLSIYLIPAIVYNKKTKFFFKENEIKKSYTPFDIALVFLKKNILDLTLILIPFSLVIVEINYFKTISNIPVFVFYFVVYCGIILFDNKLNSKFEESNNNRSSLT